MVIVIVLNNVANVIASVTIVIIFQTTSATVSDFALDFQESVSSPNSYWIVIPADYCINVTTVVSLALSIPFPFLSFPLLFPSILSFSTILPFYSPSRPVPIAFLTICPTFPIPSIITIIPKITFAIPIYLIIVITIASY